MITDADREYFHDMSDDEIRQYKAEERRHNRWLWRQAFISLFKPKTWAKDEYIYSWFWWSIWFKGFISLLLCRRYVHNHAAPLTLFKYETVTFFNYRSGYGSYTYNMLEVHPKFWRYHINHDGDSTY